MENSMGFWLFGSVTVICLTVIAGRLVQALVATNERAMNAAATANDRLQKLAAEQQIDRLIR
ncbi:MAG: hypothetical protein WCA35_09905 [Kovacikia sp.]